MQLLEACVSNCGQSFQKELTSSFFQNEVKSILQGVREREGGREGEGEREGRREGGRMRIEEGRNEGKREGGGGGVCVQVYMYVQSSGMPCTFSLPHRTASMYIQHNTSVTCIHV